MKKQSESTRPKGKDTQDRLIARETYQYVTANPRKYGVASARNERQLATKMNSLHVQQNKRLAKLSSEIHEVRVHQWKLKELDEPARDEEKLSGVIDTSEMESNRIVTRGRTGHQTEVLRKHRPVTSGHVSEKINKVACSRVNTNGKIVFPRKTIGLDPKIDDSGKASSGPLQNPSTQGLPVGSGLKHIRVRRDEDPLKSYKYKSYNLMSSHQRRGKKKSNHRTEPKNETDGSIDTRGKHYMNESHVGKINTHSHPTTSEADPSSYGHRNPSGMSSDLLKATSYMTDMGSRIYDGTSVHTEERSVSDEDTAHHEDRPIVAEENWAETLKSCRYLRKPKGYETPEISIESIFQDD